MKKLFVLFLLFLIAHTATARKFYFSSSTGSDTYTLLQAQNQATPWKTLQKMQQLVINNTVAFLPGDTLAFKRGDVFANGYANGYCSMQWVNDGGTYFTAPSGTPSQPIVITNYGSTSLPLPNWLYPSATYPVSTWKSREGRGVVGFKGVHDIVIDGIQSNDNRVPEADKANPGYTGGWIIGSWTTGTSSIPRNSYTDPSRRVYMVTNFIIKNCVFNNTTYGIQQFAGIDSKVTNCTFSNFKSSADTAGVNDILAGAIEGVNGIRCEFSYNTIKGAWAKSGRISSSNGLGGVAFDMFNLYNSRICYNTIIDCSGAFEIGNLDRYDSVAGFQYDTIAFNKVINSSQISYLHGTGYFAGNNHHIAYWNNVCISNWKDRQVGNGFGQDTYGDGQGFRPGTLQPWWFCRNPYSTFNPPNYPLRPTVTTTAGSNVITVSNATGISIGSVFFVDNDTLLGVNYQTVTVTAINGLSLTLSVPCTVARTNYALPTSDGSGFYLPVADQSWSNPSNSPFNNWSGHRTIIQYATDATIYGSYIDTMIDSRNNIFYWTSGTQGLYDRNRYKRSSNIYVPLGGTTLHASSLGGTLNYRGTGEIQGNGSLLFVDTSSSPFPELWNLNLVAGSAAIGAGKPISGFTKDFGGANLTTPPSIGLYNYVSTITTPTVLTSTPSSLAPTSAFAGGNVTATGGAAVTRRGFMYGTTAIADTFSGIKIIDAGTGVGSYGATIISLTPNTSYNVKAFAVNSIGISYGANVIFNTPPQTCTFTYGSWSTCNGTTQTRSYVASPVGCSGVPPTDSITRSCTIPCTSFTYGTWGACSGNVQTRTYTALPANCSGTPPVDSTSRTCTSSNLVLTVTNITKATCTNKSNGSVTVAASGGIPPYYYSINSTTNYVLNKTLFTGIKARTTNTMRVKDSRGVIASQSAYVGSVSSRSCP
jgi:hypothetical protein